MKSDQNLKANHIRTLYFYINGLIYFIINSLLKFKRKILYLFIKKINYYNLILNIYINFNI
jgi:hypothetical protein